MIKHFCDQSGNYLGAFDGAPAPIGAIEVPDAPPHRRWYTRNFGLDRWDEKPGRTDGQATEEVDRHFAAGKPLRLLFEIEFEQENRLRVLEGRPAITRAQYRDALIAAWKALP